MTQKERIDALEKRVAGLEDRIRVLEARPVVVPSPQAPPTWPYPNTPGWTNAVAAPPPTFTWIDPEAT